MLHDVSKNGTKWTFLREDKINLATVYPDGNRFTVLIHFADQPLPVKFQLQTEEEAFELFQQFLVFETARLKEMKQNAQKRKQPKSKSRV